VVIFTAVLLRKFGELRPRQQRAAREHHHLLAGGEHWAADLLDDGRRRALDREVSMLGEFFERHDRRLDAFFVQPAARLLGIARRDRCERQSRHPVRKIARDNAPDRAKSRNRHTHESSSRTAWGSYAATKSAATPA
jgi:hypothetical protein